MDLLAAIEERLRLIVREETERALAAQKPEPLELTTQQAADLLNLPVSWLAAAARRGDIKSVRHGHHVRFKLSDLKNLGNGKQ
jgi:excisionase family DNA binding protein